VKSSTAAVNVTLLALLTALLLCAMLQACGGGVAAGCQPLLIDISCPPGAQQQTRRTLLQRSIVGSLIRQTDGRPPDRYIES